MKTIKFQLLTLFIALSFYGCQQSYFFDEAVVVNNEAWNYNQPLNFKVDIQDTKKKYNLYFDIEHSTDYSFQNMYVQIHTTFPNGEKTSVPLSIDFMDKTGRWNGKCSSGFCKLRVQLKTAIQFKEPGQYGFEFEQFMRKENLRGIKNLAFRMEEVGGS